MAQMRKAKWRMKKWLINNFLPMWAKETVLADNRNLKKEVVRLQLEVDLLKSYIKGLEYAVKEGVNNVGQ